MEQRMSNENPNDFHWKNKLEDVGSLQEETLTDKNAIWEKLYSRLGQRPHRVRGLWYLAAACLLLLVMIPVTMTTKNNNSLVKNNPVQIKSKKVILPEILPSKETALAEVSFPVIKKNKITERPVRTSYKKSGLNDIAKHTQTVIANSNVQKDTQPASIISLANAIDSSFKTTLAVAPVKKKLKVVHINELGDPVEEVSNTKSYEYHAFQFKLINKQVATYSSLPVNNTGFNILKLKNAPSN
jgi:hypothetical protein